MQKQVLKSPGSQKDSLGYKTLNAFFNSLLILLIDFFPTSERKRKVTQSIFRTRLSGITDFFAYKIYHFPGILYSMIGTLSVKLSRIFNPKS
jgi:hypothetical protein